MGLESNFVLMSHVSIIRSADHRPTCTKAVSHTSFDISKTCYTAVYRRVRLHFLAPSQLAVPLPPVKKVIWKQTQMAFHENPSHLLHLQIFWRACDVCCLWNISDRLWLNIVEKNREQLSPPPPKKKLLKIKPVICKAHVPHNQAPRL